MLLFTAYLRKRCGKCDILGYARPQVGIVDMSLKGYGPLWEIAQALRVMLLDGFLGEGKVILAWFANYDSLDRWPVGWLRAWLSVPLRHCVVM